MRSYAKDSPETIRSLFNDIAFGYDRTNALISLNLHKKWNNALADIILSIPHLDQYLDLCSGTGEIAFNILNKAQSSCNAFLLDFSDQMLLVAKNKEKNRNLRQHSIHYLQADAQAIPLPKERFDAVTMAYGIRNIQNPLRAIQEVYRILENKGLFAILELTRPKNPFMKTGHKLYTSLLLPVLGKCVTSNWHAYNYLQRSIQAFIEPQEIEALLMTAGFRQTNIIPLSCGIATIITGKKDE